MKYSFVLIGLAILLASCSKSTKKTPSGLEFQIVKKGKGKTPVSGQIIVYDFILKDSKDSTWVDSYKRGLPQTVVFGPEDRISTEDGLTQMFHQLSGGDSVTFDLPIKDFYVQVAKSPFPPMVDSTLTMHAIVKVDEVFNQTEFEAYKQKVLEKYFAKQEELGKIQLGKDTVTIDQFLSKKGVQAQKLPSGIRYVITKQGKGTLAAPRQTVEVNYDGYLLNGTHFDTNVKSLAQQHNLYNADRDTYGGYKPFEVVIDSTSVIVGWHQALKQLNKGAKGTFYIPSPLAYGTQKQGAIGENSILVFDIEMVDLK